MLRTTGHKMCMQRRGIFKRLVTSEGISLRKSRRLAHNTTQVHHVELQRVTGSLLSTIFEKMLDIAGTRLAAMYQQDCDLVVLHIGRHISKACQMNDFSHVQRYSGGCFDNEQSRIKM